MNLPTLTPKQLTNFWAKVKKGGPNECWLWTGSTHHLRGYGHFKLAGRPRRAHRVAFHITNGDIPEGLFVCHRCDNPPCCNPLHLFAGTPHENNQDCKRKGRNRGTPKLLSPEQEAEVLRDSANGVWASVLANRFNVSAKTIFRLRGIAKRIRQHQQEAA